MTVMLILLILGLILGSFVNALVWRLHQQELASHKSKAAGQKARKTYSILTGRSMCPHCQHELAAKDLVPLFSWLALRAKCRYCGKSISWQYPAVEVATALLFGLSYAWWPLALHGAGLLQFIFWLFFIVMFVALTVYDLRWYLLPNRIVYPLIVTALVQTGLTGLVERSWGPIWEPVVGALIISGLFYALFQVSDGKWIGGGDVKLAVVLGLLAATPLKAVLVIFLASVIGTFCSIPLLVQGKKGMQSKVPFGPFLLAATVVVVLFGSKIVDWYTGMLNF